MATFSLQEIMRCPKFQKLPLSIVFEWCKLKKNSRKLWAGPQPELSVTPRLSPLHTVLWIRGFSSGGPHSPLPKTLSPSARLPLDRGRRPGLVLLGGERRAGRTLCLLWSPLLGRSFQAFGRRCVAGMAEQGTLELRGRSQSQGGLDPSGACCHSMSVQVQGPGRVTQGRASLH